MLLNYGKLSSGVIKQVELFDHLIEYNPAYIDNRYNKYKVKVHGMSCLRLGYITACLGRTPNSILDVGYGNGDFLSHCSKVISECYGNDVSNYPIPNNCTFVTDIFSRKFEVITFFDCLEHFENIDFVSELKCDYLVVSVPWCHYFSDAWFANWKHRRPDEHLWHFDLNALKNFMVEHGFNMIDHCNIEDSIRSHVYDYENILTACFTKI